MANWHVYMLQLRNGKIYVGHTNGLKRRLTEHAAARGSKATKESSPTKLIYTEKLPDRISAVRRERQLKRWSRAKKLALATDRLDDLHMLSKSRHHKTPPH